MLRRPDQDWWSEERAARERGFRVVAGIDEAGRGPLAGPVVAACVVLPFEADLPEARDSKTLTPEQRERAYEAILAKAEAVGIGLAEVDMIDSQNILRATHHAMRCALERLPCRPDVALIDGLPVHPFPIPQIALVKGDARSASVAAASIIAKVTRDRLMVEHDAAYPQYGFALHKGYPTPDHLARLAEHGPCPLHRRSFAPVARLLPGCRSGSSEHQTPNTRSPEHLNTEHRILSLPLDLETRREIGDSGETVAEAHLRRLGWQILKTRFRCRGGEVDIIATEADTLVFVEVKARRGHVFSAPGEAVDARKRARLLAAAEAYLAAQDRPERNCRFDVVEVVFRADGFARVNLIRNAFLAGE